MVKVLYVTLKQLVQRYDVAEQRESSQRLKSIKRTDNLIEDTKRLFLDIECNKDAAKTLVDHFRKKGIKDEGIAKNIRYIYRYVYPLERFRSIYFDMINADTVAVLASPNFFTSFKTSAFYNTILSHSCKWKLGECSNSLNIFHKKEDDELKESFGTYLERIVRSHLLRI